MVRSITSDASSVGHVADAASIGQRANDKPILDPLSDA